MINKRRQNQIFDLVLFFLRGLFSQWINLDFIVLFFYNAIIYLSSTTMKQQLPSLPKSTKYLFLLSFGYTFIVLFTTIVNLLSSIRVFWFLIDNPGTNENLGLDYFEYFLPTLAAQMYYYMIFWIIVFCLGFVFNELYLWKKKAFVGKNFLYSVIWFMICSSLLVARHLLLWNGEQESIAIYLILSL